MRALLPLQKSLLYHASPFFEVALLASLSMLTLHSSVWWLFTLVPLIFLRPRFKGFPILVLVLFAFYAKAAAPIYPKNLTGSCYLVIQDKRMKTLFGKKIYTYKGLIRVFSDDQTSYKNIPCSFTYKKDPRFVASQDYFISQAKLTKGPGKYARLKILKESLLIPVETSFSPAEFRYKQKQKADRHLQKYIENKKVYKLLCALSLGYLDHKTLGFEFSKLGLSHLLAVSGFHFALLSFVLYLGLSFVVAKKLRITLLLAILGAYTLYLGGSSSVTRAFLAICIYFIGELFSLRPNALNTLSFSLVLSFLIDPASLLEIGFQLSYAATFGILFFYKHCAKILEIVIPKRAFKSLLFWPIVDQGLYLCLASIRSSLALSLAVTLPTLPFLLTTFEKFPLISILYNLFLPPLFSLTMILLILGFASSLLPAVTHTIHQLNQQYTNFFIQIVEETPRSLEFYLYRSPLTVSLSISILISYMLYLMYFENQLDSKKILTYFSKKLRRKHVPS